MLTAISGCVYLIIRKIRRNIENKMDGQKTTLSEEDMLMARAIALSLEQPAAVFQADIATPEAARSQPTATLHTPPDELTDRRRSNTPSPDLGISAELDSIKSSRNQASADAEACIGASPHSTLLPLARLSSLHDMPVEEWEPDKELLELVMGMAGISENSARRALYHTGNGTAEEAISWVFENIGNPELHDPFQPPTVGSPAGPVFHSFDDILRQGEDYKMVFAVNAELKMSAGKIAAQVGHATLSLYHHAQVLHNSGLPLWEELGAKKIVLRTDNEHHLLELYRQAEELHLPVVLVSDAGRTQVRAGSMTVLGVFGKSSVVDQITGKLRLL